MYFYSVAMPGGDLNNFCVVPMLIAVLSLQWDFCWDFANRNYLSCLFSYRLAPGSLTNLVSVLCWHVPCPVLAHLTIVHIGHFLLSGLINELQGSSNFFSCSVTISDFQVRGLHQLDFFAGTGLFLFPYAAAGILVHVELAALSHSCKPLGRCTLENHFFILAERDFTDCHRFWQGENDFQALCCLKEALPHHIYDCTQWLLLVTHFQMDPPVAAAVIKSCLLPASLGVSCLTMSGTYICGQQLHHGKCKAFCKMKNQINTWITTSWNFQVQVTKRY